MQMLNSKAFMLPVFFIYLLTLKHFHWLHHTFIYFLAMHVYIFYFAYYVTLNIFHTLTPGFTDKT